MMTIMASDSSDFRNFPHDKTRPLVHYSPLDHGPLNGYKAKEGDSTKYYDCFRGASYYTTTPIENEILLYRLHGGQASEFGQFWTLDKREAPGALRDMMELAILPEWGNDLSQLSEVSVPRGIQMIEGYAAPQKNSHRSLLGGSWQVFIPLTVLVPLLRAHQTKLQSGSRKEIGKHLSEAFAAQDQLMRNMMDSYCSTDNAEHYLKRGNRLQNLSASARSFLTDKSVTTRHSSSETPAPPQTSSESYLIHKDTIKLPNGSTQSVSLNVRKELVNTTRREYMSGKTRIIEITYRYKIIYVWS